MGFVSQKVRRKDNITIFTALLYKVRRFVVLGSIAILCTTVATADVLAPTLERTIYVFPGEVNAPAWENADSLYSQDLDDDALFQNFNKDDSAYLDTKLSRDGGGMSVSQGDDVDVDGGDGNDSHTAPEASTEGGVNTSDETDVTEESEQGGENAHNASAESVQEEQSGTFEPQSGDSVPASEPSAFVPFEFIGRHVASLIEHVRRGIAVAVALAHEDGQEHDHDLVLEAVEGTATETMSASAEEVVEVVSPSIDTSVTEAVSEDGVDEVEGNESETDALVTEAADEDAIELFDDISTTSNISTAPQRRFCEGEEGCETYQAFFSGFAIPELDPGEIIEDAQIRISLAARPKAGREDKNQGLVVEYRKDGVWYEAGQIAIMDEISNAINGGYFLYALPVLENAQALKDLDIRVTYFGDPRDLDEILLDSVWIELSALTISEDDLRARVAPEALENLEKPQQHEFLGKKIDFLESELPYFTLKYHEQRNFLVRIWRSIFADRVADPVSVSLIHGDHGDVGIVPEITMTDEGLSTIIVNEEDRAKLIPGKYTLEIKVKEGDASFIDTFEFQWGLLAQNVHKAEYEVGEVAQLSFAALSENGNTVCDANLLAYIIRPDGVVSRVPVAESGLCNGNNVVDAPDYFGSYQTVATGTHTFYLERVSDGGDVIAHTEDTFSVVERASISIERLAPTRIYPVSPYAMELQVRAHEAFTGTIVDQVPFDYIISDTDATIQTIGSAQYLSWPVSLAADEVLTLRYTFDSPDISPYLYRIGPAVVTIESGLASFKGDREVIGDVTPHEESSTNEDAGTTTVLEAEVAEDTATGTEEVSEGGDVSEPEEVDEVAPVDLVAPEDMVDVESEAIEALPTPEPLLQETFTEAIATTTEVVTDTPVVAQGTSLALRTYTEKRSWQIASDATGNMLLYWASTTIPTGWTCVSCAPADVFYQRFVMGSSTAGVAGGAATHTHSATGAVTASASSTSINSGGGGATNVPTVGHGHSYTPTISTDSNLPAYRELALIQYNSAGEPPSIPTGAIAVFDATVPTGWTRYSAQDGRYIRSASTSTVGTSAGSNTHTHTISGNALGTANFTTAAAGDNLVNTASAAHTHSVSTTTAAVNHEPPYREAILGQLNATSSATDNMIAMWTDTPSAGWNTVSSSSEPFSGQFVKASTTYGGTGGAVSTTHGNIIGIISGAPSGTQTRDLVTIDNTVTTNAHTHSVNVTSFSTVSTLPPYRTAIFAKRAGGSPPASPTLHDIPFDNEKSASSTMYFEFTANDPDGSDTLVYQFQWDDDGNLDDAPIGDRTSDNESGCSPNCFENLVTPADTHPYSENERMRFTIQTSATEDVTYFWRVRAKETVGDTWSSWSTVRSVTYVPGTSPSQWLQTMGDQFAMGSTTNVGTTSASAILSVPPSSEALVVYGEGAVQTPRYQVWNGTSWGGELSAQNVGGTIQWTRLAAGTTRDEYLLATQDASSDVNVQIFSGTTSTWGNLLEVTTTISDTTGRGVDVAYETTSGDALVVYCDGDSDPSYRVWNGSGWVGPTTITTVSANNCEYIALASDPNSDEIILVTRDTGAGYEAQVWSGSAWGNSQTFGSMTDTAHEGIAVEYEESGDQAIVVVSNGSNNSFLWNAWSGGSWNASAAAFALGDDFEWGVLKRDVGSDNMALCYIDQDEDPGIVRWNGLAWQTAQEVDVGGLGNDFDGRPISCEFETTSARDGYLMIPFSDTTAARYRYWDGATLQTEASISTIASSWEVGTVRTGDDNILAYFHDDGNTQYDFSYWEGTSWSAIQTLETNTSVGAAPFRQPIGMVAQVYQSSSGVIDSDPIDFDTIPSRPTWGEISWNTTEPSGTDVVIQVLYGPTCSALVPDGALTGNSTGFQAASSPIDISGLSTSTYNQLCLRATLSSTNSNNPEINDWTISWERESYLYQSAYWWYANTAALTPTDPWPAGLVDLSQDEAADASVPPIPGDVMRLRLGVRAENVALSSASQTFKLQYASSTGTCSADLPWLDVGAVGSSTAKWRGYDNGGVSDGATVPSVVLSASDTAQSYEEENNTVVNPNTIAVGNDGEWDFVLEHNADAGENYCFRMVTSAGGVLAGYEQYPMLTTNASPNAPTLSVPFDNEKTSTTSPSFQFLTSDTEANDLTYQVQIDDDPLFGSVNVDRNSLTNDTQFENLATPSDKDPFTNGETIEFTLSSALTNGTTYYWRVRAEDPDGSGGNGEWSDVWSFTIDTSLSASAWFQTQDAQFLTNTNEDVATSSNSLVLQGGFTAGTSTSGAIDFDWGTVGNAWGSLAWNDTETSSDLKYVLEYFTGDAWAEIPDSDLSGNSAGFDTSPISLLGLDTDTYNQIRIVARFTDAGASPALNDWTLNWGYTILPPDIEMLFANERMATTTPTFEFSTTDPQGDALVYQIQWSTTYAFTASTTRTSDTNSGFANITTPADTSPFNSGESIQFTIQSADALTDNTTYWWRVRARDPGGSDSYSRWTDAQSFTASSTTQVSTWYQTTNEQFLTDIISGATTSASQGMTVATTAVESLVAYAEGTAQLPRYRTWNGSAWTVEEQALTVDSAIAWLVTKPGKTREEYLLGTLGTDGDVTIQVFEDGAWGNLQQVAVGVPNTAARGFDITYESSSGDAMVVSCDGDADPVYYIWNGVSWTLGGTIDLASSGNCAWVKLMSDPISDEIILMARDSSGSRYELAVWSGSSWGNTTNLGSMNEAAHEGVAGAYEESGNQAVVAASNGINASFVWKAWNGSAWTATATVALGDDFESGSLVADVGSDNMALCYVDEDNDIGVVRWTGAAWTGQTELEIGWAGGNTVKNDRPVDCEFEVGGARDGYIMVAYSDTTNVRHRAWNGSAWDAVEQSVPTTTTIVTSARVQLERTGGNQMQLIAYDITNDRYDYATWNGTTWSAFQSLETDGISGAYPYKEPFMIAARNPGTSASVVGDPGINFYDGSGPYWQQLSWVDSTPGGSDILYQVEYYNAASSTWDLVPDSLVPGNSTGTSTSPINLTGILPVASYSLLRPVASLTCNLGNCPTLLDWTITWSAGINISGSIMQYDQISSTTSGTVAVALDGVLQTGKTGTISNGTWSIANVNASPGDVVTVFVQGAADANEAAGVTVYDGSGDISGMNLFERHLSIGSNDNSTTTNANIGHYDFTNTEDIFYNVDGGNDLSVCATTGCSDAEIYIQANNIYQLGSGGDVVTHDLENNGTLILNGNTIRVSGSWDNNATTSSGTSTVIMTATSTPESINETGAVTPAFYNLTFGEGSGTATWTLATALDVNNVLATSYGTLARGTVAITVGSNLVNGASGLWTGTGTTTLDGASAATWSDAAVVKQDVGNLVIDGSSKSVTLGSNVQAYSVTIGADDILDASVTGHDITVLRHWTNNNTFVARTGEIIFAATTTNAVVNAGSSSFYDLTFSGVGGSWSFSQAALSVGNDFTISTGTVTLPTGTTTVAGSWNSTGGLFAHNNAGVAFTSTGAESITLAGSNFTNAFYNATFSGSGSWSFVTANSTTTNDLTISAGTVTFPSGILALGGSLIKSGGTIAANGGTLQLTSASTETIQTGGSSLASLLTTGSGSWSFVDANITASGNITIGSGTLTAPSGTFTVGGSWSNSATFTHNSGTVLFNSTATGRTIAPGNSSFANVTINSSTGAWTVSEHATSTGTFTLTAGTFTVNSGITLSVGGTFTNSLGGASTTWTGSTLSLDSGTAFAMNLKSSTGDQYGTLRVAGNTDASIWNSSSTAYTIAASGSLYSQDHSGVDGDLYIFGAYERTSGTEHWSYATDFDGTALGGSPRQVDVRFASGATATFSSSTLAIVGTAGASTTIASQSGTYTLAMYGGTTTAAYYSFDNLGLSGLTLASSTRISSLADGSFTPGTNGGTGITVSSSTIDANPGLQIYRVAFATTTAIIATNVTQTGGTPTSYWWFRNSTGNLDGEAYDSDTGDPGSVRWDDSNIVITVAGTVYADDGATPLGAPTCDGSTAVVTVVVEGGSTFTGPCNAGTGAYSIANVTLVGDPTLTVYLNTNGGVRGTTVTKTPTQDITDLDIYANRVMTRHEDTAALTIEDMTAFDEGDDTDVRFVAATGSPSTLTVRPDTELHIMASTTFAPGGNVTLEPGGTGNSYDASLHIDNGAAFVASSTESHSIGGSFAMDLGASFTSASSTVTMTATSSSKVIGTPGTQTIAFNNLVFSGTGAWNLTGDITAVAGIALNSGTLSGTEDIAVTYGSFSGNGTLALTSGTVTIARSNTWGGTTPWSVYNLILGNGSASGTTTPSGSATTTVLAGLTVSSAHRLDAGASHWNLAGAGTPFTLTGTFDADTSLVRYSATTSANVTSATYYDLELNPSAGTPTYTGVGLGISVLNALTIGGSAPAVFTLDTSDPAMNVDSSVRVRTGSTLALSASAAFTIGGDFDNDGTLTANGGTLTFDGAGAGTLYAGASSLANVTVNKTGSFAIAEHATATASFTLTSSSAFTVNSGVSLAVGGTFSNALGGAATTWTGSTLSLYGGSNYQINASTTNDTYATLNVAADTDIRMWNSSAASTLVDSSASLYSQDHAASNGALYIYGDYVRTSGTDYWSYATDFDGSALGGSPRAVTVSFAQNATATYAGGSLNVIGDSVSSTTITNQGSGTYALRASSGTLNMQHYVVRNINAQGLYLTGTPTITTLSYGNFEVAQNGETAITVGGSVITANPAKTFTGNRFATSSGISSAVNVTATGTALSSWRFTNHMGAIAGEAYDSDPDGDPGYIVWDDSAGTITISGNVYSDEGTTPIGGPTCDGVALSVRILVSGVTGYSTPCNAGSGAYSISNISYSPGDTLAIYLDTAGGASAAHVIKGPISSIANAHLYQNRVIVRHEDTDPVTIADMALWSATNDADIPYTATDASPDTLSLPANTKLIVWSGKTFAPGGNVTVSGGGGGGAQDGTVELQASAVWTAAGTESHSIGGSLLLGASATITPAQSTFTFTTSGAARTVDTNNGSFYNVSFNGSGSWSISDTALVTQNDFTITSGTVTMPSGTTTVAGSFQNTGGAFAHNNGTLLFTSTSGGESVRVGQSAMYRTIFDGVGGSWSFTDTNATSSLSLAIEAGAVTFPSGTYVVGGRFDASGGTFTHNSGTVKLIGGVASTSIIASTSDFSSLTIESAGSYIMEDTNVDLLGSLHVNQGVLTMASGTVSIGGSLIATGGTFAHASGTVLMNSSDTGETINPGSSSFNHLSLASAGGGWTIAGHATTTGNFSLTSASQFTMASSTTLYVGGVFTNTVGGTATTWTGSTININTGTPYTINTSTQGGDQYQTLIIGANTDLRMWNSAATSTSVASTSSLYSQDHGGINGALYIYGDYVRTSGADYWSYATDFDGTALGGSPRAVTVSFAAFATATFDGGTLNAIGTAAGTTTITNQGSGTYALIVRDGTLNAQYYAMRNANASGLSLLGLSTITSIANGDFELAVAGGTTITLASSTLNANASSVWNSVRFATSSAITGANVTLSGATVSAWTFTGHTGNLAGEAYDIDGGDACGSIRWSDSTCLITEQTHFRWRNDNGGEGVPDSEWFDQDWSKRKRVTISNADATPYTDAVVEITVAYDADMQADFDDLRFTDESGTVEVPYWIETYTASTEATVWVKVPTLAASDRTDVFMYYGNGAASDASSGAATFEVFDDFEDASLSEYSGQTSLFSVSGSGAYERTNRLIASNVNGRTNTGGIYDTSASGTVTQGQTIRYLQYVDLTGASDESCTLFAVQSAGNNYAVCLEVPGVDRIVLAMGVEDDDASGTTLASSTVGTWSAGWHEVEIRWNTDDSIDVALYRDGSLVATTSATESSYTSGGIGFTYWFQHGGWDVYTARPLLSTEPTYVFGAEQAPGGATWYAALDATASGIAQDTIQRLRFVIENSGLTITNQQFRLEYAAKGGAPSCESVSSGSYSLVPAQASCGTSPICMEASTFFTNYSSTTDLLTGDGSFTFGQMVESPATSTQALTVAANEFTELEYALEPTSFATDAAYCLRVTNDGTPLDSYAEVAELGLRFDPQVLSWSLNGGEDIVLTPGTTTAIYATGTVSDSNGYADITMATATIYRSTLGPSCSADNNSCYQIASTSCSLSGCSGATCEVSCRADIHFFADPTDIGVYSAQDWRADIQVTDSGLGFDTQSTFGSELITLRALAVDSSIAYGALEVSQDTGAYNATTTVENIGNDAIDVLLNGTDLTDGVTSLIPVALQKYATSTFTYASCTYCSSLSTVSTQYEIDLSKPTTTTPVLSDQIFWGISIPFGVSAEPHEGTNTFMATGD